MRKTILLYIGIYYVYRIVVLEGMFYSSAGIKFPKGSGHLISNEHRWPSVLHSENVSNLSLWIILLMRSHFLWIRGETLADQLCISTVTFWCWVCAADVRSYSRRDLVRGGLSEERIPEGPSHPVPPGCLSGQLEIHHESLQQWKQLIRIRIGSPNHFRNQNEKYWWWRLKLKSCCFAENSRVVS